MITGATDFHVHMPPRGWVSHPFGTRRVACEEYVSLMDSAGVERSVVFTIDGLYRDTKRANDELYSWVAPQRLRLVPFCTVNPRDGEFAVEEVRRCVTDLQMKGVKLHPWLQAFHPLEGCVDEVCAVAEHLGVPVLFHDGTPPYSTPLQIAQLAKARPRLTIVLGHSGLHDLWQEAVWAACRFSNIYLCLCATPVYAMQSIVRSVPRTQLLWGSDGGLSTSNEYVVWRLRELSRAVSSPEVLQAILVDNPGRLLGLGARRETVQE